jgi:hypothetical protein
LVETGASGCTVRVDSVDLVTGAVTAVTLVAAGAYYTTGVKTTTVSPAGGLGCTINVTAISSVGLDMYWVRCRILTPPTQIPEVDYVGIVYAGVTNRGNYNATNNIVLSAAKQPLSYSRI